MLRWAVLSVLLVQSVQLYAWGGCGHSIAATIAYFQLTKTARAAVEQRLYAKKYSPLQHFIYAANFADRQRERLGKRYKRWHYMTIPLGYSPTNQAKSTDTIIVALNQLHQSLLSKSASLKQQAFDLRFFIHLVADIHQPLHTTSLYSKRFPTGDRGGNRYTLPKPFKNLHKLWDGGGGLLRKKGCYRLGNLKRLAKQWARELHCPKMSNNVVPANFKQWALEGHQLAKQNVYTTPINQRPSKAYLLKAQQLSKKQLFLSACRLSAALNSIYVHF